jgi:hypothetical protein
LRIRFATPSQAIHGARHLKVAEDNIQDRLAIQQHDHCFVCIHRFNDFVAAVSKVLRNWHPHQNVTLYYKDGFMNLWPVGRKD